MFENLLQNPVYMLGIVAAAVIILIVLVMKFKVNAFVSLLIVSVLSAFAAGMTPGDTLASITGGMGSTLGGITIIVALGAMLGAMLEVSGGAKVMANTLIKTFGINKAPLALVAVGIIVGTPVFLDVAFIILIPVVYSLSKQTKKSVLFFSLPLLAGLAVGHTLIPPTPGPVTVANIVGADLGSVIMMGYVVGIPAAICGGIFYTKFIAKRINVNPPEVPEVAVEDERKLPSFGIVVLNISLPLILIVIRTVCDLILPEENTLRVVLHFIGAPEIALLISVLFSFLTLGLQRGISKSVIEEVCSKALGPAGIILAVTGAGGVFKQVLIDSGIGTSLADMMSQASISPIFMAYLIATMMRISVGSATVSMTTAAGIMAPVIAATGTNPTLVVMAIGCGAINFVHFNDSGFWLISKYSGTNEKETLKTWSAMATIIGITGIIIVMILSIFIK